MIQIGLKGLNFFHFEKQNVFMHPILFSLIFQDGDLFLIKWSLALDYFFPVGSKSSRAPIGTKKWWCTTGQEGEFWGIWEPLFTMFYSKWQYLISGAGQTEIHDFRGLIWITNQLSGQIWLPGQGRKSGGVRAPLEPLDWHPWVYLFF